MLRLIRSLALAAGLLYGHLASAQMPPCTATLQGNEVAAIGQAIDRNMWLICRVVPVNLGNAAPNAIAVLLRSAKPTGLNIGLQQPEYDVNMVVGNAGQTLYSFNGAAHKETRYFMDDTLEVHRLSPGGFQGIIFHSGAPGVSDSTTEVHVVVLAPGTSSAMDAAYDADEGDPSDIDTTLIERGVEKSAAGK